MILVVAMNSQRRATLGTTAVAGKPNSGTARRDCGKAFVLRSGDPGGDKLLQPPQMRVMDAALLEILHRVVEIVGA